MITESMKKNFVGILGQLLICEDNWNRLSFTEKMELAESVLDSTAIKIKDIKR